MLEKMFALAQMPFAQMAILAIIPLSILCGIMGTLIIANRLSYVAGGLTHASYGGVGIGVYFGIPILVSTMFFSLILAIFVAYLIQHHKHSSDNFIGATWAFGMALGILLMDLTPGYKADMVGYLFGNILVLSHFNLLFMSAMALLFVILAFVLYPQIQTLSYDEDFAKARGVRTKELFYLLILMIAVCVSASMQAVGLILVIALLSIPTFIAQSLGKTLGQMMIIAALLNLIFCFLGLLLSFYLDLSSGASIVMVSVVVFLVFFFRNINARSS